MRTLVPDIILDIRYASADNFMGMPLDGYLSPRAFLMPQTAEALKSAQKDFISFGYCLKLYDAYRPVRAERHMIRWAKATNNTSLLREGYLPFSLSPYRSYGHACGNAVDVTLVDKNGRELDMGTTFDAFTRASWTMNAKGFILKNRLLLKSVMEHHGFTNFAREWWHYNFKSESGTPHDDVIR